MIEGARPDASLATRVARGGMWIILLRIVQRVFNLVRLVVLAHWLAPQDFGLMGVALLTLSIADTFTRVGIQSALIQKKGDIRGNLDLAWTVQLLRGLLVAAMLFACAPSAARFFGLPEAAGLLRTTALIFLLWSLNNIGLVFFRKELAFDRLFAFQFAESFADCLVSIIAVFVLRSAWGLMLGRLASAAVACFMSYRLHPYRPRLDFHFGADPGLFRYGFWVLVSAVMTFILTQGDDLLVARLLGVTALGYYQLAYKISNIPVTEYSNLAGAVMFPAYAKLQDEPERLRAAYERVLWLTAFFVLPTALFLLAWIPDLIELVLGAKWLPAATLVRILVFQGVACAAGSTAGPVFLALGRPRTSARLDTVHMLFLFSIIWPLTASYGTAGIAIAVAVSAIVFNAAAIGLASRLLSIRGRSLLSAVMVPVAGASLLALLFYAGRVYPVTGQGLLGIGVFTVACGPVYLAFIWIADWYTGQGHWELVSRQIAALRGRSG